MANAVIVNVTSGLGFVPMARIFVYCATKAALHSVSMSLRFQLGAVGIRVVELVAPMVDTELDRGARAERGQVHRCIARQEVAEALMVGLAEDRVETAVAGAADPMRRARDDFEGAFASMNGCS